MDGCIDPLKERISSLEVKAKSQSRFTKEFYDDHKPRIDKAINSLASYEAELRAIRSDLKDIKSSQKLQSDSLSEILKSLKER